MTLRVDLDLGVAPVQTSAVYTWMLTLTDYAGRCCLQWSTNAPFRPQQGRICLYARTFPADPEAARVWCWDNEYRHHFVTDEAWGPDWCAGWIAQTAPNGPYVYLARTPLTEEE